MYSDPSQVRDHIVSVKVNDEELKLLQAAADKAGLPLSTFCRVVAMKALASILEAPKE